MIFLLFYLLTYRDIFKYTLKQREEGYKVFRIIHRRRCLYELLFV